MNSKLPQRLLAASLSQLRAHLRWPLEFPLLAPDHARSGAPDPDGAQWMPADALIADAGLVGDLIDRHGDRVGARQRSTAATLLWKDYCQVFSLLPVTSWFIDRRVPDMASSNLVLRTSEQPPFMMPALIEVRGTSLAEDAESDPALEAVADEAALVDSLAEELWDHHLAALGAVLASEAGIDSKIFRGLALSVAIAALSRVSALAAEVGRDPFEAAKVLVAALGGNDLMEIASLTPPGGIPEPMALRFVCCQAYRVTPHLNCSTCPLISDDERTAQLQPHGYAWQRL